MRKLKLQVQISVDGFVAGRNGELDWMTFEPDEKMIDFVNEITDSSNTILLGRKMTNGFISYWESVKPDSPEYSFARKMVETPKIVFSKTIKTLHGKNVSVENHDLRTAVEKLKNQEGKDIIVYGGASFVSSLIKDGLIDEFNLFINPVMINKGMRIFSLLDRRQKLKTISSTAFENGVTVIRYKLDTT